MRKSTAALLLCILLFALPACQKNAETISPSVQIVSGTVLPSSASPVSPSGAGGASQATEGVADNSFASETLLSLIGKPLSVLKDSAFEGAYGDDYFIYEVGSATGALEYYSPYICFYFDPMNYFNPSGLEENAQDRDPFGRDDLTIRSIALQSAFDTDTYTITSQDSLKRFFAASEPITYDLLAGKLQQSPKLEHHPNGGYTPIVEFEISSSWIEIPGGTYRAAYTIHGATVQVTYLNIEGSYIALAVCLQ